MQSVYLFINANRLVKDDSYQESFDYIQKQLMILVSLTQRFNLEYPFAIIFTQCDLLSSEKTPEEQILPKTQSLLQSLEQASINYQCFYSAIKIEAQSNYFELCSNQVTSVFSWIVTNLYQNYQEGKIANLRILSVFHCLNCGSDRFRAVSNISLLEKLQLLIQFRWQYFCRDCGQSKTEFLPFVFLQSLNNLFKRK